MTANILAALPLAADELSAIDAPSDAIVYVRGGRASVVPLNSLVIVSPESWLDISQFKTRTVNTLGFAYAAPEVVAEPLSFDVRAKLDGAPKATPELLETIAAFRTQKSKGQEENVRRKLFGVFASAENVRAIFDYLSSIISLAAKLPGKFWREQSPSGQRAGNRESDVLREGNVSGALRRFAVRLLHRSRLTKVLGRRQAAYMAKMMAMFEDGNLDDALRHAVPLSDVPPALDQSAALGVPAPRTSLSIIPGRSRSSLLIGAEDNVMSYLRQLYRSAFERLVAQGRVEEAAFVLAELLRSNEEAVAFLERHGKLRLAAELAEARELPPGLVVRQWFLAGENERAIKVALRTQAFADAVLRLEKTNKEQAVELRRIWAEVLADAGNYAGAVDVLWPVTNERLRAREWMDRAIDVGGPVAARMLARKLSLVPEEFADVRDRSLAFLEDESFEQRTARLLFARTLCQGERNAQTRTLARATARAILRDAGQDYHAFKPKEFQRLVDFSGDGALRADVPPFPRDQGDWSWEPLALEFADADRGSMSIPDAALLGDGRMLVALGEAGVRLLTRDGRTITHFDQPAHRLVLSDHGDRAIALARRGEVWRLVHLDLLKRSATDWCEAHIDAFAPSFDGSLWFIGAKGDFYAIDTNAAKFEALWRVPDAGESVIDVACSASSCSFLTTGAGDVEQWVYRLPLLTLRSRMKSSTPPLNVLCVNLRAALSADGVYLDQSRYCS
ncbi:MAG TPA: bpX6 domain-containing protein, partial [Pyrinomonadaceae bacterium]|nr:bpX6 domain-containing protein [Pyrinomonadaceae bacterium]